MRKKNKDDNQDKLAKEKVEKELAKEKLEKDKQDKLAKEKSKKDKQDKAKKTESSEDLDIDTLNEGASNNWVISGDHTESGKPILTNDPHVENTIPTSFYITKMYLPGLTLSGATIPGIPFFSMGSNNNLAWGITTENSEVADLCEEKIEGDFYYYDGKKHKLTTTIETINVKDEEPIDLEVKWTRNGPIVDTIMNDALKLNFDYKHYSPLSLRVYWYKFDFISTEFWFKVMFAKSKDDFVDDIEKFSAPNLNFVYASTAGDIGYYPLGFIPIKKITRNSFCQGYNPDDDFITHIRREETPRLNNPSKGFIVTANNKIATSNYKFISPGFHNNVRANRIREMIEKKIKANKFKVSDSVEMLKDLKDNLAADILPKILQIVEKAGKSDLPYFEELKNWDFVMRKDSNVPMIYSVLEYQIGKLLVSSDKIDNNKSNGILSILQFWNFINAMIEKINDGETFELKQCAIHTGTVNCEKFIVYAFESLDNFLEDFKDDKKIVVNWEVVHKNHYRHLPFDTVSTIKNFFSRVRATGGNRNTVKVARGNFSDKNGKMDMFNSNFSPSIKLVSDLSDITRPYIISDTGNSGKVNSKFYDNLMGKSENVELIQLEEHTFETNNEPNLNTIILRNQ